jgi:hypothetical protein
VRFAVEHDFSASPAQVADVLCDPGFQSRLDLPDLARPEVVQSSVDGTHRLLKLRYEYIGELNAVAKRIVGSRKLQWIQQLRLDTATGKGTLSFSAEEHEDQLNGEADVTIVAIDSGSRRRIAGDLHVRIPLVGGSAERRIVPGLVRRLDVEADELAKELEARMK